MVVNRMVKALDRLTTPVPGAFGVYSCQSTVELCQRLYHLGQYVNQVVQHIQIQIRSFLQQ
jgi:hypothetical protein